MAIFAFFAPIVAGLILGINYSDWKEAIDPATFDALFWLWVYVNCAAISIDYRLSLKANAKPTIPRG